MAGSSFTGPLKIKKSDGTKVTFVDADGNLVAGTAIIVDDGDSIDDGNGNEVLEFGVVASAVNHLKVSNAATGNPAILIAEGTDNSVGMSIQSKQGAATSDGGVLALLSGAGGATSGASGAVTIDTGTPVEGAGGAITVTAAAGVGTDQDGGAVSLIAGAGTGTGAPGVISLTAGDGSGPFAAGGAVNVTAGGGLATSNSSGGDANITGGLGDGTGDGGGVNVTSGDGGTGTGAGAGGDSGTVTIASGLAGAADTGTAGAGGVVSLLGSAGGDTTGVAGTGGAGSNVTLDAGAGGADTEGAAGTGGDGGSVVMTAGAAGTGFVSGVAGIIKSDGLVVFSQTAPAAKTTTTTLTNAEILGGMITANQGASGTATYTTTTGTQLAGALPTDMATGDAFLFRVVNISTDGAEDVTLAGGTDVTNVGNNVVASNAAATDQSAATFMFRKTGATTFDLFRVA